MMEWLNEVFTNPHAALAIEQLAHYDTKGAAASRMLVIRGVDDEASLSLAAGSIGSRLNFLTLVAVIPAIYAVVIVFVFLVSFFGLQSGVSKLGLWIGGLIIGVFFGALILFFVPGAFKSLFGREFLINGVLRHCGSLRTGYVAPGGGNHPQADRSGFVQTEILRTAF